MPQSYFPKIIYDVTKVRLIVNGLEGNPKYRDTARAIRISGIYKYVNNLEDPLLVEEAATINTHHKISPPQTGTYTRL